MPGSRLPAEHDLGRQFGVNRHTAREALKTLRMDGSVYSIKGKGNFVSEKKIRYQISQKMRFSSAILAAGFTPGTQLLAIRDLEADENLARLLCVKQGDGIMAIDLVRFANDTPLLMGTSHLPTERFATLKKHLVGSFSLYSLLKDHFDVDAIRHQSVFETVMPDKREMNCLQIRASVPLLKVQSITNDQFGKTIELTETKMRGDIGSMVIDF